MDGKVGAMGNPAGRWTDHAVVFAAHVATAVTADRSFAHNLYIYITINIFKYIYIQCVKISDFKGTAAYNGD